MGRFRAADFAARRKLDNVEQKGWPAFISRLRGSGVREMVSRSVFHGSAASHQVTNAFCAIQLDSASSPLANVKRDPLPTRRSAILSCSESRQPNVSRSVEPSALPR